MNSDSIFFEHKRVMVTGGGGFVGGRLVKALRRLGAIVHAAGRRPRPVHLAGDVRYSQVDLSKRSPCLEAMSGMDFVFHLAAAGDGFHANLIDPAKLLTENLLLNTTVLDCARRAGVKRFLLTSSLAVYPSSLSDPVESDVLEGPPFPGEQYYAWAKRMGEIQARSYYEQYQLPIAIVRPSNPYGPGDNFDPDKSHVIPALIRRVVAGEKPLTIWGSGRPQRSFIFVDDVVDGMLLALEKHAVCDPINLATGEATSIAQLAASVLRAAGRSGADLVFDETKPDGALRRVPGAEKARKVLGMNRFVKLEEGLSRTLAWYAKQMEGEQENHELLSE